MKDILTFLGFNKEAQECTKIYMDNKSAIQLCTTLKSSHKTKHINMRINYIRQLINEKVIELHFVDSENNVADILTKALPVTVFEKHRNTLLFGHSIKRL